MQYVAIKEAILEQIDSGVLLPKQKLPAERMLAESFGTTRVTLREALSVLEAEGRIYREDRRGWFISPPAFEYNLSEVMTLEACAQEQGSHAEVRHLAIKSELANKQVSQLLQLPPFTQVFQVRSLWLLDERPICYVITYLKQSDFKQLNKLNLASSLGLVYQEHYQREITSSHYQIRSACLFGDNANTLRATEGSPAVLIERLNQDKTKKNIDCQFEYWRQDAVALVAQSFSDSKQDGNEITP